MSSPATINHQEVHISIRTPKSVVTQQPSKNNSHVSYDGQNALAIFTQSPTPVIAQKPDPSLKPKDFVITSCAVLFLCNFIFGLLGYHFGVKSNYAWQLGDINLAKGNAKKALLFVVIGVIVGIGTYVLAFVLYFVVYKKVHNIDTSRPS
ncbi:hypothetical protein Bpfe_006625 [Biomphalaria pfeifferi]|uniref:Uncharacterized protein n=1 Tax=Biomphalaria pfeifferi TaxID=112525 RepID=A0AAD8C0E4_BIOPF|nr:hypothetical protein Bpfe_006625 [Biomphalaria pfeifferi]